MPFALLPLETPDEHRRAYVTACAAVEMVQHCVVTRQHGRATQTAMFMVLKRLSFMCLMLVSLASFHTTVMRVFIIHNNRIGFYGK
ncbi:hypothetical protein NDU88_001690 [Pleurodeles waltl]|uniref:Uncharacterized protein n=1 Tax=Pleurodeles waltl TaxID=8319 RepID=A0AAV7M0E1_PLEWA|nr:hypothetical protein NDU88_001690 [Pleurodeles waltl]